MLHVCLEDGSFFLYNITLFEMQCTTPTIHVFSFQKGNPLFIQGFHVARVVLCQVLLLEGSPFSKVPGTRFFCPKDFLLRQQVPQAHGRDSMLCWLYSFWIFLTWCKLVSKLVRESFWNSISQSMFKSLYKSILQRKIRTQTSWKSQEKKWIYKRNQFKNHRGKVILFNLWCSQL